jgi:hypothetical protein
MKFARTRRTRLTTKSSLADVQQAELARVEGGMINLAQFGVGYCSKFTLGPHVGDPDPYSDDHLYPGLGMQADNVTPLT